MIHVKMSAFWQSDAQTRPWTLSEVGRGRAAYVQAIQDGWDANAWEGRKLSALVSIFLSL